MEGAVVLLLILFLCSLLSAVSAWFYAKNLETEEDPKVLAEDSSEDPVCEWSAWSPCEFEKDCDTQGTRSRMDTCGNTETSACERELPEPCRPVDCVGAWSEWSTCYYAKPCEDLVGVQHRFYHVETSEANGGANCPHKHGSMVSQPCGERTELPASCTVAPEEPATNYTIDFPNDYPENMQCANGVDTEPITTLEECRAAAAAKGIQFINDANPESIKHLMSPLFQGTNKCFATWWPRPSEVAFIDIYPDEKTPGSNRAIAPLCKKRA